VILGQIALLIKSETMESTVEIIKSKLTIADVVGSYIKLEKAGINMKARCPFHNERTPSFFISPERGTFHCFGCNRGGDIFTFVEEIESIEFKEALRVLADRSGVSLNKDMGQFSGTGKIRAALIEAVNFYRNQLTKSVECNQYLKDRGLEQFSIEKFQIGFAPKAWRALSEHLRRKGIAETDAEKAGLLVKSNKGYYDRFRGRILFPFLDIGGRPIGFSARILPGITEDTEKQGKYINSPETSLFHKSKVFFGINEANITIREMDKVILVEGQLDVILAHQAGVNNVIGVSGTAFTPEHVSILKRFTDNILVVLDSDNAGFRASEKVVRMALSAGMYVSIVALPRGTDPADMVKENSDAFRTILSKELAFIDYALILIRDNYNDRREREKAIRDYLYPVLGDTYNEIEKDRALQDVAALLGVAPDATRRDFEKWFSAKKKDEISFDRSNPEPTLKIIPSPLELVATRLLGMAIILESSKDKIELDLSTKIWQDLDTVLGSQIFSSLKKKYENERQEDLVFEVEAYYRTRSGYAQEVDILFSRLHREVLKFQFSEAMDELRLAEAKGDKTKIAKCLSRCQDISKELSKP